MHTRRQTTLYDKKKIIRTYKDYKGCNYEILNIKIVMYEMLKEGFTKVRKQEKTNRNDQ